LYERNEYTKVAGSGFEGLKDVTDYIRCAEGDMGREGIQ